MEQNKEDVSGKFEQANTEGTQALCPHCQNRLEQSQYVSNYWQWNDKTQRYERDEPEPKTGEPFCPACRAEYRDSLYK